MKSYHMKSYENIKPSGKIQKWDKKQQTPKRLYASHNNTIDIVGHTVAVTSLFLSYETDFWLY